MVSSPMAIIVTSERLIVDVSDDEKDDFLCCKSDYPQLPEFSQA
jgi:hypothetical protein